MLPLEKNLEEIIQDIIKIGPKSISGITREINAGGYKYHKLVITGYLMALEDLGYVKQREVPPSKVYYKTIPLKKDIYQCIGEKIEELDLTKREQNLIATYVLGKLFNRPIFSQELKRCGFSGEMEGALVDPEQAAEARKLMLKAGIKIPKTEPAYEVKLDLEDKFNSILLDLLIEQFGIKKLIYEGTQSKLEMD